MEGLVCSKLSALPTAGGSLPPTCVLPTAAEVALLGKGGLWKAVRKLVVVISHKLITFLVLIVPGRVG